MIARRAPKTRATTTKLNKEAIMAEIEANIRKKVKVYLAKRKRVLVIIITRDRRKRK